MQRSCDRDLELSNRPLHQPVDAIRWQLKMESDVLGVLELSLGNTQELLNLVYNRAQAEKIITKINRKANQAGNRYNFDAFLFKIDRASSAFTLRLENQQLGRIDLEFTDPEAFVCLARHPSQRLGLRKLVDLMINLEKKSLVAPAMNAFIEPQS